MWIKLWVQRMRKIIHWQISEVHIKMFFEQSCKENSFLNSGKEFVLKKLICKICNYTYLKS